MWNIKSGDFVARTTPQSARTHSISFELRVDYHIQVKWVCSKVSLRRSKHGTRHQKRFSGVQTSLNILMDYTIRCQILRFDSSIIWQNRQGTSEIYTRRYLPGSYSSKAGHRTLIVNTDYTSNTKAKLTHTQLPSISIQLVSHFVPNLTNSNQNKNGSCRYFTIISLCYQPVSQPCN